MSMSQLFEHIFVSPLLYPINMLVSAALLLAVCITVNCEDESDAMAQVELRLSNMAAEINDLKASWLKKSGLIFRC